MNETYMERLARERANAVRPKTLAQRRNDLFRAAREERIRAARLREEAVRADEEADRLQAAAEALTD